MKRDRKPDFIIVIGASAGGLNAISELVSQLPEELNVAVFIVVHVSKIGLGNFLIHRIQKYTPFICTIPKSGETIEGGLIYVASPDEHLLVKDDKIVLGQGPTENRWRPSIDVLFRSAAASYANKVIGIILTGYLNDGASGMLAIKKSGGYCIVQDPNEAEYPDMPLAVLENMEVDYCVPLLEIGPSIQKIMELAEPAQVEIHEDIKREAEIAEKVVISLDAVAELGTKSIFACPDCGGGLWNMEGDSLKRYRCHIGHTYTTEALVLGQLKTLEATLWIALRMMEERRMLLTKISEEEKRKGLLRLSTSLTGRALDLEGHIEKLKEVLFSSRKD